MLESIGNNSSVLSDSDCPTGIQITINSMNLQRSMMLGNAFQESRQAQIAIVKGDSDECHVCVQFGLTGLPDSSSATTNILNSGALLFSVGTLMISVRNSLYEDLQ